MKTIINVECMDQELVITNSPVIASGGVHENFIAFNFCEKWDGFGKTAVFYRNEKERYYSVIDSDGICEIPHEVTDYEGTMYFGVYGEAGDVTKTSKVLKYKINQGAMTTLLKPSEEPTPDIYQQLLSAYGQTNEAIARESAEREASMNVVNSAVLAEEEARKSAILAEENARKQADATEKAERQAEIAVERARIDQLTKMEEGSTTGDAELMDVRVDAFGQTHETAGDAVRSQYVALNTKIDDNVGQLSSEIVEMSTEQNLFDVDKYTPNAEYSGDGTLKESSVVGLSDFIFAKSRELFFSINGVPLPNYRNYYAYEFDSEKQFIRRVDVSTLTAYTPTTDCVYVRFGIVPSVINSLKIEYGQITKWSQFMSFNDIADSEIMASVNMFGSIAGVGDSYTAGFSANSSGVGSDMKEQSYIATLGKRAGVEWANYGVTGATSQTYISNANGLLKLLADDPHDLYIINLGQNDVNNSTTVGTVADIHEDYTLNADTFCGFYGEIVQRIKNHAPNAKIILVKSWVNHNKWGTEISYQSLDNTIQAIADYYHIPCIAPFDDRYFHSNIHQNRVQGHPTTMGYSMMGLAMERLISKCIVQNPSYFMYSTIG